MNELTEVIKRRRSVRKFEPKPISEEIIRDILDCARLAPTANNLQPWLFGAVTDPSIRREIAELTEYGKFIKEAHSTVLDELTEYGKFIKDCAVCFAVFADSTKKYFLEDGCAATENILLACTAHGIGSCWVAGHKKDYAESVRQLLNVSEPYTLIALIAAGYSGGTPSPKKKSLDDVAFFNRASH
ncbi:MAG: nitroreductase family protein [Desulfatiglandales bacterium]